MVEAKWEENNQHLPTEWLGLSTKLLEHSGLDHSKSLAFQFNIKLWGFVGVFWFCFGGVGCFVVGIFLVCLGFVFVFLVWFGF